MKDIKELMMGIPKDGGEWRLRLEEDNMVLEVTPSLVLAS